MNDEQHRVALFQAQPTGPGLFFRPAALSLAYVAGLHGAHSALLDEKTVPAELIQLVLTGPNMPQFITLASLDALKTRKLLRADCDGRSLCLAYVDGRVFAVDDMCTHEDASLSKGSLHGECVKCPLHGSRFDLNTGEALDEPAEQALNTYEVRVEGDDVQVQLHG
jgi:3-phenylpropionate/trans-cinnamate dioxygenase ferredoxin subunit